MGLFVKGTTLEDGKVLLMLDVHGDLVAIHQVRANTWQVFHNGNVEHRQLFFGTNAAELQQLRRIVCTGRYDEFLCRLRRAREARTTVKTPWARPVKIFSILELNSSGFWSGSRLIESDFGHKGICANIQREALRDGAFDELADVGTITRIHRQGHLEESLG